jgi:hypothetical protein
VDGLVNAGLLDLVDAAGGLDHVEIAILEWVGWYNHRRHHEAIEDFTPVAVDGLHYAHRTALTEVGDSTTRVSGQPGVIHTGMLSNRPTIHPRQPGQQPEQERPGTPVPLHSGERAAIRPISSSKPAHHRSGSTLAAAATARSS